MLEEGLLLSHNLCSQNTPQSLFYIMSTTQVGVPKDEDGNILIDRDPSFIDLLVKHMNSPGEAIVRTPPFAKYMQEYAQYFGLPQLEKQLLALMEPPASPPQSFPRFDGCYVATSRAIPGL